MDQGAAPSGGTIGDLIVDVDQKLSQLATAAEQAGMKDAADKLASIRQQLSDLVDEVQGGGAPQGGPTSPEAGASKGAVPMEG